MSHEFQVHHLLNELVSLLHVKGTYVDVDSYADVLLKNRTPYVTTQVSFLLDYNHAYICSDQNYLDNATPVNYN